MLHQFLGFGNGYGELIFVTLDAGARGLDRHRRGFVAIDAHAHRDAVASS